MSAKHFYPSQNHSRLLNSALLSAPLLNPSVSLSLNNKVIYHDPASTSNNDRVALLSGGGSGHEPSFSSFVGHGMLAGAVAGTIFASPSAKQVQFAIRKLATLKSGGVCVIVMNYTVCIPSTRS
jgi:triose/dihydroxyacetone kinase / FAD-AMP lyase (cyclizing)